MMNSKSWTERIIEATKQFADIEYQRRAWVEPKRPGETFSESANRLFDDSDLPGFLSSVVPHLSNREELTQKFGELEHLLDAVDEWQPGAMIISLPEWPKVVSLASEIVAILSNVANE